MNRRNHEDMHLFSVILNQEIRRLSTQVSYFMLAERSLMERKPIRSLPVGFCIIIMTKFTMDEADITLLDSINWFLYLLFKKIKNYLGLLQILSLDFDLSVNLVLGLSI